MKTPERIKKDLEDALKGSGNYCPYKYSFIFIADALDLIQQLEAQVPKWISVEERLPEEDGVSVLCAVKTYWGTCVYGGYYSKTSNRVWPIDEDIALDEVTHWMPLPEPPKEQEL